MKYLIFLTVVWVAGCAPSKRTTNTQTQRDVRLTQMDSLISMLVSRSSMLVEKKDSLAVIPGSSVGLKLRSSDLQPAFTADGTAVSRVFLADSMNSRIQVTVQPDGNVAIDCRTDSLFILVQNLIRITEQKSDSIAQLNKSLNHKTTDEKKATAIVKVYGIWYYLKWVLGIAGAVCAIIVAIKLILKAKKWTL